MKYTRNLRHFQGKWSKYLSLSCLFFDTVIMLKARNEILKSVLVTLVANVVVTTVAKRPKLTVVGVRGGGGGGLNGEGGSGKSFKNYL